MVPALGSAEKSKITEYKDVRAYILFRKPGDIRLIGLYPVVRNKAFDMVSDGTDFKLYIPARNRFLVGRNEIDQPSQNKLENLRPQHFLEALLVRPIDARSDKVLLENFTDEDNAFYILHVVHVNGGGSCSSRGPSGSAAGPQHGAPVDFRRRPATSSPTRATPSGTPTITWPSPSTSKSTARATSTPW
jgi:hypothetical protein